MPAGVAAGGRGIRHPRTAGRPPPVGRRPRGGWEDGPPCASRGGDRDGDDVRLRFPAPGPSYPVPSALAYAILPKSDGIIHETMAMTVRIGSRAGARGTAAVPGAGRLAAWAHRP